MVRFLECLPVIADGNIERNKDKGMVILILVETSFNRVNALTPYDATSLWSNIPRKLIYTAATNAPASELFIGHVFTSWPMRGAPFSIKKGSNAFGRQQNSAHNLTFNNFKYELLHLKRMDQ